MRFQIHLTSNKRNIFLPIDYQYSLAAAVYKLVARGDEKYARFLHDSGFVAGRLKRFKLFSFSGLTLPRFTVWKEKGLIELHDNRLSFLISFVADEAAEALIKGIFMNQRFSIGDRFSHADLEVIAVEAQPRPFFTNTMHYRCVSPMVVEHKNPGEKYGTYLAPDHKLFADLLYQNLIAKTASLNLLINTGDEAPEQFDFHLIGSYKSKLITIKPHSKDQTRVRGLLFDFTLNAPEYIQEIGYYAGLGMNNAMGFGAIEIV